MSSTDSRHGAGHDLTITTTPVAGGLTRTLAAAKALAVLRIATGFVFLWAFLDKTFGLGFSTGDGKSWLEGGSPTKGFLSHVEVGPFQGPLNDMAGNPIVDVLFMAALLGVGVAAIAGVALRIAAISGTLLMLSMWVAEWPLAQHLSTGEPSGSSNPIVDYHIVYALALIVAALTYAGTTWGLGAWWARQSFVQKNRWLL